MPTLAPEYEVKAGSGLFVRILEDDGLREGEPGGVPEAIVRMRCAWSERFAVLAALRGTVTGSPGVAIVRTPGIVYPESPNLWCVEVSDLTPFGTMRTKVNGWVEYDWCDLTAKFSVLPYDPESTEWAELSMANSGQFVTLKDTTWRFVDGSATPLMSEVAFVQCQNEIQYKVHRMPFIPQEVIDTLTGTINAAPVTILGRTYPAGVLLMLGADTETKFTNLGVEYAITWKYQKRPVDWNYYFHPTSFAWVAVSSTGLAGGVKPYAYGDFSLITGL